MKMEWKIAACPEEAGISSKGLLKYLDAVERSGVDHHSILVLRNGILACKMNFAPYDDQTPHVLYSLSKSFTSAAAGFAVQEGLLRWEDKVMDILPEYMPENPSEWLRSVTLHHLLCMGSGLREESDEVSGLHWARDILGCDCDHAPGTHFHYNSHGTYLVSCMVQKVTGQTVRDYLMPRLFDKLGIPKPDFDLSPEEVCCGGFGLHLSCDSIARFGQCLLQNGVWEGEQVLPAEWLEKATAWQIDNSELHPGSMDEWGQGYGYQFWQCLDGRFRGDGAFGQVCMIDRKRNTVVAMTAGTNDMGMEYQLLREYLFPAIGMEEGTEAEKQALKRRLETLSHPWPENDGSDQKIDGLYENDSMRLAIEEKDGVMTVTTLEQYGMNRLQFGKTEPVETIASERPLIRYLGRYGWKEGKLTLLVRTPDAPTTLLITLVPGPKGFTAESSAVATPRVEGRFVKLETAWDTMDARCSYRGKYESTLVPHADLRRILEAGLAAPSGCNAQTTSLIAVDDRETMEKLYDCLGDHREGLAPAMICVLCKRTIVYADRCFATQDYSAAIENMLLAITALGYASCWIEGRVTGKDALGRKMADVLNVPEDRELVCYLPVGVPAETARCTVQKKPFEERAWFNGYQKNE